MPALTISPGTPCDICFNFPKSNKDFVWAIDAKIPLKQPEIARMQGVA